MEIVRVDVDTKDFTIPIFSDTHFGNFNTLKKLVRKFVASVEGKNAYVLNGGDNIEAILPTDKRFSMSSIDVSTLTPQAQADEFVSFMVPIRDQIKALGIGNHEWKLINTINIGTYISDKLSAPFGGYMYIAQFYYKDKPLFKIMVAHGSGTMPKGAKDPVQRDANRRAWLKRKLEGTGITDCIVMAMGHTHHLMLQPPTFDTEILIHSSTRELNQFARPDTKQNDKYISPERRWYGNSGSFLPLYSKPGSGVFGYAEIGIMEPTDLGWLEVIVEDGRVTDVQKRTGNQA